MQPIIKVLCFLSLLGLTSQAFALVTDAQQVCSSDADIILNTQAQVDNFQATYGGVGGCDTYPEELRITGADITNLEGLSALVTIGDRLLIDNTTQLTSLSGLRNLKRAESHLWIFKNSGLTDLSGLNSLEYIGGLFFIGGDIYQGNTNLTSIGAFPKLKHLNYALPIYNNPDLVSLDGLNLESVNDKVDVRWNPSLSDCSALIPLVNAIDDGAIGPGDPNSVHPDIGKLTLGHNAEGCNSADQILNADFSFLVTKDFDDGNTAAVDVILSCDGASPQTESLSENQTETLFTVRAPKGSTPNCSVNVEDLPGYTRSYTSGGDLEHESNEAGCHFYALADNHAAGSCHIEHAVESVEVVVDQRWNIGDESPSGDEALRLLCKTPLEISGPVCSGVTLPDGTQCVELTEGTSPFTVDVFPQFPNSHCWVEQVNESAFVLENDCDALHPMVISVGSGASCIATFAFSPPPIYPHTPTAIPALGGVWLALLVCLILCAGLGGGRAIRSIDAYTLHRCPF